MRPSYFAFSGKVDSNDSDKDVEAKKIEETAAALKSRIAQLEAELDLIKKSLSDMSTPHSQDPSSITTATPLPPTNGEQEQQDSLEVLRCIPLIELEKYYRKHGLKDSVVKYMKPRSTTMPGNRPAWTMEFTCPLSGRVFRTGLVRPVCIDRDQEVLQRGIRQAIVLMQKAEDDDGYQDDDEDVEEEDDDDDKNDDGEEMARNTSIKTIRTVYYTRRKVAVQATAARALDILRFEETGQLEPRLCEEDPSDHQAIVSSYNQDDVMSGRKQDDLRSTAQQNQKPQASEKKGVDEKMDHAKAKLLFTGNPIITLGDFYMNSLNFEMPKDFKKSNFKCEKAETEPGRTVWTAQFTCPVSQRVFYCSTLRPEYAANPGINTHPGKSFEIETEVKEGDDSASKKTIKRIFYQKKTTAIHAAACRALDVLRFELDGSLEPRLCDEDPLGNERSIVEEVEDDDNNQLQEEEYIGVQEEGMEFAGQNETVGEDLVNLSETERLLSAGDKDDASLRDEEEDNYTQDVVAEPWFPEEEDWDDEVFEIRTVTINDQSPALRLLEKCSQTKSMIRNGDTLSFASASDINGSTIVLSEDERYERLSNIASKWVNAAARPKEPSLDLHGINLPRKKGKCNERATAKVLLASLADLNLCSLSRQHSTEASAIEILRFLWKTKDSKPDTEVFNLYLRCLEADDAMTRAIRAESIVEQMKNRGVLEGHLPPEPDRNTYNILLGIWAQVGGKSGRYTKLDGSFDADRESFLAVLSSSSYASNDTEIFDTEFATQCVKKMTKLQQGESQSSNRFKSLIPDIQVMNAPLRWSGGLLWNNTRPTTRRIHWDNFLAPFCNGFRPYSDSDVVVQNAIRVDGWVRGMNEYGVSPDIESYEAAIQAWAKTGTREGLENAERIVEEIANYGDVTLRLQTLHPILASWLYVQQSESPSKIQGWIDFLANIEDESVKKAIKTDRRVVCLQIACQILAEQGNAHSDESKTKNKDAFALAEHSTSLLDQMITQIKATPDDEHHTQLHMLMEPFILAMTAWNRALPLSCNDPKMYKYALEAIVKVVDSYENVLQEATAKETRILNNESITGLSEDLRALAAGSYRVYSHFILVFDDILDLWHKQKKPHSKSDTQSAQDRHILLPFLRDLERVVRRLEETHEIGKTLNPLGDEWHHNHMPSCFVYADRFEYNFNFDRLGRNHIRFGRESDYWVVAGVLEKMQLSSRDAANVVPLCYLLKRAGSATSRRSNLDGRVNGILDQILEGGQHRDSILASMKNRGKFNLPQRIPSRNANKKPKHSDENKMRGARRVSGNDYRRLRRPLRQKVLGSA